MDATQNEMLLVPTRATRENEIEKALCGIEDQEHNDIKLPRESAQVAEKYSVPLSMSNIQFDEGNAGLGDKSLLDNFLDSEEPWRKYQRCLFIHVWAVNAVDKYTNQNFLCTKNRYSLTVSTTSTHSSLPEIQTPQTDGGERFNERWIIFISKELKNIRFELIAFGVLVATSLGQGVLQVPAVGNLLRKVCNLTTSRLVGDKIDTSVGGMIGLTLETIDIVKGLRTMRNEIAANSDVGTL